MAKSTTSRSLIAVAFLAAVLLALFVARNGIFEILLTRALADRGLIVRSLTVVGLSHDNLRLKDLRLGSADQLSMDSVAVSYQPSEILDGQIRTIAVSGLRLTLDLTGEGPPLGEFQPLFRPDDKAPHGPAFPQISLADGLIALNTPLGPMQLAVSGSLTPEAGQEALVELALRLESDEARADGSLEARLAPNDLLQGSLKLANGEVSLPQAKVLGLAGELHFSLLAGQPQAVTAELTAERLALTLADVSPPEFRKAELQFSLDPEALTLSGILESESRAFGAAFSGALTTYQEDPSFTLELTASASHESVIWDALALPKPVSGTHRLAFRSAGQLPPLDSFSASPLDEQLLKFLDGSDLEWSGEDLTYPGLLDGLNGSLALQGSVAAGRFAVYLQKDAVLQVAAVAPQLEAKLGLPEAMLPATAGPFRMHVKAEGDHAFAASIALDEVPASLDVTFALATEGLWRGTLDLASRQHLEITADGALANFDVTAYSLGGRDLRLPQASLLRLEASGSLAGTPDAFDGQLEIEVTARDIAGSPLVTQSITTELSAVFSQATQGTAIELDTPGRIALESFSFAPSEDVGTHELPQQPMCVVRASGIFDQIQRRARAHQIPVAGDDDRNVAIRHERRPEGAVT